MARKMVSNAEEALDRWPYAADVKEQGKAVVAFLDAVDAFRQILNLDEREATAAIRDYAQYRLAVFSDERLAENQARLADLEARLKAETK